MICSSSVLIVDDIFQKEAEGTNLIINQTKITADNIFVPDSPALSLKKWIFCFGFPRLYFFAETAQKWRASYQSATNEIKAKFH
jgi:hypothetical protein